MTLATALAIGGLSAYLDGKYQLSRDYTQIAKYKKAERSYQTAVKQDRQSPWYLLAASCHRRPNNRAIWTRERSWTFRELHDQTVRYAQWLLDQGIGPGDLVALYLHNSAEYIMLMFAALCIGAGPAMINYNLEGKALLHCLGVCQAKLLIVDTDSDCQRRIEASRHDIAVMATRVFTLDAALKQQVSAREAKAPVDSLREGMEGTWPYCLLFTSGTTGLPKACPFPVARIWSLGHHLGPSFGMSPGKDVWFTPMPLYHGTGVITSTSALLSGLGVAIVPRFSVKSFWPDVHDSGATAIIYVGETARYLLAAPPHPLERAHKLRLAYGNGLRPDVWTKFQERFNIPEIAEFFNSSEGMFSLLAYARGGYLSNCVGHHGLLFRRTLQNVFVPARIDSVTGDLWRDPNTGFALRTSYDVGGEILVAVPDRSAFVGYWRNPEATEKRFAIDVFRKGDLYYRTGDALRRSPDGHWYFLDRLGDTFRWKSENVATTEVSEVLGRFPGIAEANVYGVSVPEHEGRAGCAALRIDSPSSQVDYSALLAHCRAHLPRYAVPVFLRLTRSSSHMHNHKQNKVGLRKEGVDPDQTGKVEQAGAQDEFLYLKPGGQTYVPFRRAEWEALSRGEARL